MSDVTVIIPCRDAAATIGATLRSLVSERPLIRDVLVVDAGSTDGSAERARETAAAIGLPLTLIAASAAGAGETRNLGLDAAAGRFVYFIDADDVHLPGGLAALRSLLESRQDARIAVGSFVRAVDGVKSQIKRPRRYRISPRENASLYISGRIPSIGVGCVLVDREAIGTLRFPPGLSYDEDTLFWARLLARHRVATSETRVFVYNVSSSRANDRFVTAPRAAFLTWRNSLRLLASDDIDAAAIRRREGIVALKVAREHYARGLFDFAKRFLTVARAAPISHGDRFRAFRYRLKIDAALRGRPAAATPAR